MSSDTIKRCNNKLTSKGANSQVVSKEISQKDDLTGPAEIYETSRKYMQFMARATFGSKFVEKVNTKHR